jgi:hypothetical protein
MKNRSRRQSALVLTLCSAAAGYSCLGTETENPVTALPDVVDGTSPENFREPDGPPRPCVPTPQEEYPNLPTGLSSSALVATGRGNVLAVGNGAELLLLDVSDPAQPVTLGSLDVRGSVHQLLASAPGQLWAIASEVPVVEGNATPSADDLELQLRLIQFDVSDPAAPVRIAHADLDDPLWEMRARADQIWVVTARHVPEQRACRAPQGCVHLYEALVVQGFRPNGTALELLETAELPYDRRAWWGADGIGSVVGGGLHVLSWDEAGALRVPETVDVSGSGTALGPIDVVGDELRVVSTAQEGHALDVYALGATATPVSTFNLGGRTTPLGAYSLFSAGHLWLQQAEGYPSTPAEVWDLAGDQPVRVELPASYAVVLPIDGATRAGQTNQLLAIGWTGIDSVANLLSFRNGSVTVLETDLFTDGLYSNRRQSIAAPAEVQGIGQAPAWQLAFRGMGLPLGIDPVLPPPNERRSVQASVAVISEAVGEADPTVVTASLVETYVYTQDPFAFERTPTLEVESGGTNPRFELSPAAGELVPTRTGVVVVASGDVTRCDPSGGNCTVYAPSVSVFELTGEPRLTGTLTFPTLPLPPTEPNRLDVNWRIYDYYITQIEQLALPLDDRHLAFVAEVHLSCDTPEDCDALGLVGVPIAEANVGVVSCPPNIETGCVPAPIPTVYGTGQRQYFYVLDLEAPGGPAWQSWGVSSLEATSARTDRNSRFAVPIATDGILAATRLERRNASGDFVTQGEARFMLDRFERQPSGEPLALPPVNVRGYPQARLGTNAGVERWISVEAAPGATGHAQVLRMNIRDDGARIERELDLDGGRFAGFRLLDLETDVGTNLDTQQRLGLALMTPDDGCGTTRLSAIRLGTNTGDAAEPLELASTLELPADRWTLTAADGEYALLSHGFVYVLVHVDATGTLSIADTHASDVALYNAQLLGTTLFGSGPSGSRRIEFAPVP